jgi:hypothetical protein
MMFTPFVVECVVSLLALDAIRAQPIEVEPVAQHMVARPLGDLKRQVIDQRHLWVDNLAAANADQMRVRIGSAAVVAIIIAKSVR